MPLEYNGQLVQAPERIEDAARRLLEAGLTPEEYIELHYASLLEFSLHRYCYKDDEVTEYVQRVEEILQSPELHTKYEQSFPLGEDAEDSFAVIPHKDAREVASTWRRRRAPKTEK